MAKSLRSKSRRKARAVKRERYGKKELDRLKKTLGIDDDTNQSKLDVVMESVSEIAEVKDAKSLQKDNKVKPEEEEQEVIEPEQDIAMDIDGKKRIFNSRTFRDQNGSYPVWLHPRKMQKKKKKNTKKTKRLKQKTNKKSSR